MAVFARFGGPFSEPSEEAVSNVRFSESLETFSDDVQSYIGFELVHAILPDAGRCGFPYHGTERVGADRRVQRRGNLLQLYAASARSMFLLMNLLCVADAGCPACGQWPGKIPRF